MRQWSSGFFFSSSRYLPWKARFIEAHQSSRAAGFGLPIAPNSHFDVSVYSKSCTKWLARDRIIGSWGKGSGGDTETYGGSK